MSLTYEIRDPIHRTIVITEDERRVVDHPWLQRLRRICQLGFVSLVYPGAVHDRFQHSLGVMHLAGFRFQRLVDAKSPGFSGLSAADLDYGYRLARFSGLLHDVGHAPFSHTTEEFLPGVGAIALNGDWYVHQAPSGRQATHEDFTLAAIHGLIGEGVLEEGLARDVAAVLSPTIRPSPRLAALGPLAGILRALVNGELDADRCDYLLRDSHFSGVTYGIYDLQRLIACETLVPGPDGPELGLDVHGVHAVEALLLARYHMFHQVYFHKTPPAFEYYLGRALAEGEIALPLGSVAELMALRDDHVIRQLHEAKDGGGIWSKRILDREPAKLVLRERLGAEAQENFLAQALTDSLVKAGCHVFHRHSRQVFSTLEGPQNPHGRRLLCERRVLGRPIIEPVTRHSDLLAAFNKPIDLRHTYVLRQDAATAAKVMENVQVWE